MAKPHDFNLDTWLSELELSTEDKELLKTKLGTDKNVTYLRENQLRQSDYTSKIQTVAQQEAAVKAKADSTDKFAEELSTWQAEQEKLYGTNTTEVAKLTGQNAALVKYLTDNGIDPTSVIGTVTPPAPPTPETKTEPNVDTKYLTREQGISLAKWPIIFRNLDARYQALYGKPMTEAQANEFMGKIMTDTREPTAIFDDYFKVADRKVELENESREAWKAQTRKEVEQQVRSEIMSQRHVPASPFGSSPAIESFGVRGQKVSDNQWLVDAQNDFNARSAARESNVQ